MAEDHAFIGVGECHPCREFEGMQPSRYMNTSLASATGVSPWVSTPYDGASIWGFLPNPLHAAHGMRGDMPSPRSCRVTPGKHRFLQCFRVSSVHRARHDGPAGAFAQEYTVMRNTLSSNKLYGHETANQYHISVLNVP
jgi:hypothetical protein